MRKLLTAEYAGMWSIYWMYYGTLLSFGSVYLLSRGFSNYEIGTLFALASILGALIQPPIADVVDHSRTFRMHRMLELLSASMLALGASLFLFTVRSIPLFIAYLLLYAILLDLQGLLNAALFTLQETGYEISYGFPRGIASVAYSVLVILLGRVVERTGSGILPYVGVVLLAGMLGCVVRSDRHYLQALKEKAAKLAASGPAESHNAAASEPGETAQSLRADEARTTERISLPQFLRRNKLFLVLSIGSMFYFFGNAAQNTFLYQIVEDVGGDSGDMGVVAAMGALMEVPLLLGFDAVRKHCKVTWLVKAATVSALVKFTIFWLAQSVFVIGASQVLQGIQILIIPGMVYFINSIMDKGEAVKGQAWFVMSSTIGTVVASYLGGLILDAAGPKALCLTSAVCALAGCVIFFIFLDKVAAEKKK